MSWLLWIIITFFMKKSRQRTIFACWVLISILLSNLYLTIQGHNILLPFIILIIVITLIHSRLPRQLYHLFVSFTIMIGYTAVLLWQRDTPLWLFIPEFVLIPVISSMLIFILIKGFYNRLITGVLGMSLGEVLYGFILSSYNFQKTIGDMNFFEVLYFTMAVLVVFNLVQKGNSKLYVLLDSYKQMLKEQKA